MGYTLTESGEVLTETQEGITMPADYSFATVNDYIHGPDVTYENLEALCLGMSAHIEKLMRTVQDAERYRWLRAQHWSESAVAVVSEPKQNVRLGAYCPSGDLLDDAIDAAMKVCAHGTATVEVSGRPLADGPY